MEQTVETTDVLTNRDTLKNKLNPEALKNLSTDSQIMTGRKKSLDQTSTKVFKRYDFFTGEIAQRKVSIPIKR